MIATQSPSLPPPQYLASRKYVVTQVLDDLIRGRLGEGHKERSKTHLEETQELSE